MILDAAAVERLASLARIRVGEPAARAAELSRILGYVEQVQAFAGATAARKISPCPRRPDAPVPSDPAPLLSASAGADGAFVTVPRVVDRERA